MVRKADAANLGEDDGRSGPAGEGGHAASEVGLASEKMHGEVGGLHADVGEDGEDAALAQALHALPKGRRTSVEDLHGAVEAAVHPVVGERVFLDAGDGEEGDTVMRHDAAGEIPVAKVREGEDDAAARCGVGLEFLQALGPSVDMAADPAVADGASVEDFARRQSRIAKRQPGDFARLAGGDAEDGTDAPFRLATTPTQDMEREAGNQPREANTETVRQNAEETFQKENPAVFDPMSELDFQVRHVM